MKTIKSTFDLDWNCILSDYTTAVNWSPNGDILAMISAAGEVKLFVENKLIALQEATNTSIDGMNFSADGQFIAVGGQDGKVKIWHISNNQLITTLDNAPAWVDKLVWSPRENLLAFSLNRYVQIWNADIQEIVVTLNFETSSVLSIDWSSDGKFLAIAGYQGVKIWRSDEWDEDPYFFSIPSASAVVAWSGDGKYLASGNIDKTICVLDTDFIMNAKQAEPWLMHGFPGKIRHLAWSKVSTSKKEPLLASSSAEGIVVWEKQDDASLGWGATILSNHFSTVEAIEFAPDSLMLASAAADSWLCLWKNAKKIAQTFQGADKGFSSVAWHPQGNKIAAGGQNGEVMIWSKASRGLGFG
ncbi:WD40 repeat domain-containing protein [Calothrix sp. CCY 0018]|uniref:WD40 repeat domain-containing protein n=1 Tax=Calothrix sp. CCY 0018 TaxID=3103864 RepID=UPI0039C6DA75